MKEIISSENGFVVKDENGNIVSIFDRDEAFETLLKNNKHVTEVLDSVINQVSHC